MGYVYQKSVRTSLLKSFNILYGLSLFLGGKVNMNNLGTVLNNLGIKLADMELKDLAENMHVGGKHIIIYTS